MTRYAPKFWEEYSTKLPALALFTNLGWLFLPPEQSLAASDGKADQVALRGLLRTITLIPRSRYAQLTG